MRTVHFNKGGAARPILCTGFKSLRKETVNIHQITVVDARMGRGKSSAAIRYMNENKGKRRFLYITPFLDEVGRICE